MRHVYHVTPAEDGWKVSPEGSDDSLVRHDKASALAEAKRLARLVGRGQVIVHGSDGRIQEEWTYGKDPRDVPG